MKYRIALALGLVLAGLMHLLAWYALSNEPFTYLDLPGSILAELSSNKALYLVLEIGVNTLFYSALLWVLAKLFRRVRR